MKTRPSKAGKDGGQCVGNYMYVDGLRVPVPSRTMVMRMAVVMTVLVTFAKEPCAAEIHDESHHRHQNGFPEVDLLW